MVEAYYKPENYEVRRSVAYQVRRASALVTCKIEALFVDQDVSFIQWIVLMNLRDNIVKTASEICMMSRYDSGAMVRVLDQLEQRGLLERNRSLEDRRVVELRLTQAGKETVEALLPRVITLYNGWFESFSEAEIDTLVALLVKLNARVAEA